MDPWDRPEARRLVDQQVARAVAPYRGLLADSLLVEMEHAVRDALYTHPATARLLTALAPPVVHESGEVFDDDDALPDPKLGSGGGAAG